MNTEENGQVPRESDAENAHVLNSNMGISGGHKELLDYLLGKEGIMHSLAVPGT